MRAFLKNRWVLFVVLTVFIIVKIPQLHYAYYWDESWPYAVAIKDMYRHGISLMPTAIDAELSRGHPLFFHAIAAGWMNIFGSSHYSMHSFALLISILFLIAVYEAGLRLFNQQVASLSIILVAIQVVFFVQASFVLFEMLVAFLTFLSLYFYVKDKFILTTLCLTALFYTKESGLIAGFVLGADALAGLFNKKNDLRIRLSRIFSIIVPTVLIGVFFIIQKLTRGWYIFPLYNDLIGQDWALFWYKFKLDGVSGLFVNDLRNYYFILLLGLCIGAAIKTKNYRYLILFFPATVIYYCTDDMRSGRIMPGIPFFIVFIISIVAMLFILIKIKFFDNLKQQRLIVLICAFVFCFLCFSAMNFFTPRYLLAAIVPLLFFDAVVFEKLIRLTDSKLFYPVILLFLTIGFFSFKTNDAWGDADPGAFDGIEVQQREVDYFENNNLYNKNIGCFSFLSREHLTDPATGFLHSNKVFKNTVWAIEKNTDYVVFDNLEEDYRYSTILKDTSLHQVYRFQKGRVWTEIYKRSR